MSLERLQKIIAASGITSRREAEAFIQEGRVKVNGKVVNKLGSKADLSTDLIMVNNKPLPKITGITYLLYKPKGVVSSSKKQKNETIVTELVPPFPTVYPIGRLDRESEGLILLSNNGELAQKLTHPSFLHFKTYEVVGSLSKDIEADSIQRKLLKGVKLGDGLAKADKISASIKEKKVYLEITIHEGRHHQIRRMCATIGIDVIKLKRVSVSGITLKTLKPGHYRILESEEIQAILSSPSSL